MIYKNLSIEELREYPYPNLMAEQRVQYLHAC